MRSTEVEFITKFNDVPFIVFYECEDSKIELTSVFIDGCDDAHDLLTMLSPVVINGLISAAYVNEAAQDCDGIVGSREWLLDRADADGRVRDAR